METPETPQTESTGPQPEAGVREGALRAFWERERRTKEIEMQKKAAGQPYDPHYNDIEPDELVEEDMELAKKLEDRTITRADIETHREKFYRIERGVFRRDREDIPQSRRSYLGKIIDQAASIIRQRERSRREI